MPHIGKVLATFQKERLITILKARQIGLSTTIAAYVLWFAIFKRGANILLYSKGQLEARELLDKAKRIYEQLPDFLKLKMGLESREEISFPTMNSFIRALPSTETAGIGYTTSIIVWDEHAEHEYARENFIHAKPTIDKSGQCISCFTENPWDKNNLATELFEGALNKKNGWFPMFFPYTVMPGRNDKWYEDTKNTTPEGNLDGLTPELYMYKNYPRSIEEALSVPQTVSAFDKTVLKAMTEEANKQPRIHVTRDGLDYNYINIYRDFHLGEFYIAASDVSLGVGKDYQATTIMNARTGVIVADILDNSINEELFSMLSLQLLDVYNNPKWYPEFNLYGRRVIDIAKSNNYRNLGYRDAKREKPGFLTDEKTRADLFAMLIPAINNYQITIFNSKGIQQFGDMVRNADKSGRIEARSGGHDDYPIAVGICWLMKKLVSITPVDSAGIDSVHFAEKNDPQSEIMERVLELKAEREHWEKELAR
uniref:Terminase n=1 Tax=viral metagenome TaxID=1070528 RepID=A0A6M3J8N5_9ZZZZ